MKRHWVILLIAGSFILITLVIALLIHISFFKNVCPDDVCHTPQCVKISTQILNYIDNEINPCDNFYDFVCGGFIKNSEISNDADEVSARTIVNDDIQLQLRGVLEETISDNETKSFSLTKGYFQICMNTDLMEQQELTSIRSVLEKIGGWPVLEGDSWDGKVLDWFYYIYKLRQIGLSADYVLKLNVDHDFKNTTFHILEIEEPNLSLPQNYFIDPEENRKILEEYRKYMTNVAIYFGADEYQSVTELEDVFKFETELAKIMEANARRSNITQIYNIMTVQDLEIEHSTIPWLEYFNNMIAPYAEITSQERILILTPNYIKNLEALLQKTSKRAQINYIVWKAVQALIPYLNADLRELKLKFDSALNGVFDHLPRWKECVREVYKNFPIVVSIQYVNAFPMDDVEENVSDILQNIKMEYIATIEAATWIDKKSKKSTVDKLINMHNIIGYSPDLLNDKKFEEAYSEIQLQPNDYLRSFLNISLSKENFNYKHLRELKSRTAQLEQSLGVQDEIFYNTFINTITISAGKTKESYFNNYNPNYFNYGGIGFEIGREIARAFFDSGHNFDKNGDYVKWEREDTEDEYAKKETCVVDQYTSYEILELDNKTFNGILTLENNIADNFGVKLAYEAYIKWAQKDGNEKTLPGLSYTPIQLFWISFALNRCAKLKPESLDASLDVNTFAPSEFRVIGSIVNIEDFAKDFDCPSDANMNPAEKCNIW